MERTDAYYAEMLEMSRWWTSRLGTLLQALRDRLIAHYEDGSGDDAMAYFDKLYQAGEYMLVADALAATLSVRRIPITATERGVVREILYKVADPHPTYYRFLADRDDVMASLNVVENTQDLTNPAEHAAPRFTSGTLTVTVTHHTPVQPPEPS
ncbi:hypothetical protein ACWIGI_25155 [Nocardia sp. NPDC055321]